MCVFCTVFLLISVFRSAAVSILFFRSTAFRCYRRRCECRFLSVVQFLSHFDRFKFEFALQTRVICPPLPKHYPFNCGTLRSVFPFCTRIATAVFSSDQNQRYTNLLFKIFIRISSCYFRSNELSFRLALL